MRKKGMNCEYKCCKHCIKEIDIDWYCKLTNNKIYEQMTFDGHNGEEIRECPYKNFEILDNIK